MPKASQEFPPDEFDLVDSARPRSPHRAPKSLARRLLPFILAIILGPILAYVIVTAVTTGELPGWGTPSASSQATGSPDTVTPSDVLDDEDAEGEASEEPTTDEESTEDEPSAEDSTEEDEPAADPDLGTRVIVLNSTQTAGLAGRARDSLVTAGWTNVVTGNYSGTLPESTVFYAEDDPVLQASAEAVAAELGIEAVELDAEQASDPITVVLEADFTP